MKREARFDSGIATATGTGSAWRLLGPGGGGAQYIPAISPHNPATMLVACDMTGAYITKDAGHSWAQFNLRNGVNSYAFDPVDENVIYAGDAGLFRSADGGESWQLLFPSPVNGLMEQLSGDHADFSFISGGNWPGGEIQIILVDETDNANICIGILSGKWLLLYRSSDAGVSWCELAGVEGCAFHALCLESARGGCRRVFCITDRAIYAIPFDGRMSPETLALPDGVTSVIHAAYAMVPSGELVFWLATRDALRTRLWKSEDHGESWQMMPVRMEGNAPAGFTQPELTLLAACGRDAGVLYAGVGRYQEYSCNTGAGSVHEYFGVIRSGDGGKNWRWVYKSDYETNPANLETGWVEREYGMPWHGTGPKGVEPIGLAVCPTDADICYMTDMSSSFLTTDGGETWKQLYSVDNPDGTVSSRGLEVTTCYGVHFDPFDVKHIAVSYTDIGLFHSRDSGQSWRHGIEGVPVAWGNTCYWVAFDPDVPGRSWSAWGGAHDLPRLKMMRSGTFRCFEGGVCKSCDGMASWQPSNRGMPGNCVVTHILLDPASPPGSRTIYAAGFDRGVYKSTDDGMTWALKDSGIINNHNAWRLTLLPDGTLYLLVAWGLRGKEVVDGAVYRSVDGTEHWEKVRLPAGVAAPNDLVVDPAYPETMYLSCWPVDTGSKGRFGGLYTTQDSGASWQSLFDQSAHVYAAAVHPLDSNVLFALTFDGDAWYSVDKGKTWKQIKGYDFKWGHRPVIDPADDSMLYITTFGSGIWHGPWKR
jgi:photosystem II stability/assembly factor-like uncharacterized protein